MDRILTLNDLYEFCQGANISYFSAEQSGSAISIQVPSTFEVEETDNKGLLKLKIRLLHTGVNRKGRCISKESAEKNKNSFKNRPVLAHIHQLDNGEWDFGRHAYKIVQDKDGNPVIQHDEKQVGSITEADLFFEVDEETGKEYLCCYAVIPEFYTKAADILRMKNGVSRCSCEISVQEMEYHAKEQYLDLIDWYAVGLTLLGRKDDGTIIQEGMEGCRAFIIEEGRNSEMDDLDIKTNSVEEEAVESFEEETLDEGVTAETEEEVVAETEEEIPTEEDEEVSETDKEEEEEVFSYTFELSFDDIRCKLYAALDEKYKKGDYPYIEDVFSDYFVYRVNEEIYGQKYAVVEDVVSLIGKEYKVVKEILTEDEAKKLQEMRSNYDNLLFELEKYKAEPDKIKILESNEYSSIADSDEFKKLKEVSAHFDMSVDEVSAKADEILLNFAKSESRTDNKVNNKKFGTQNKKTGRYGNLFCH